MRTHLKMYKQILEKSPALYEASELLIREEAAVQSRERKNAGVLKAEIPTDLKKRGSLHLETTACVFAPLAVSFCRWVLAEAQRLGLKRVYFLSRDGYQFYRCAAELAKALQSSVEVRYLYVSRYSLRIPCFFRMGEEALGYICLRGMEVSFLDLMERAGLNREEAERTAAEIGYQKEVTETIPLTEVPIFRDRLKDSPFFMGRMKEISRASFDAAAGYLTQEGLLDQISWGIVDSGWTGSTQQVLGELLEAVAEDTPFAARKKEACRGFHGFYFGLFDLPRGSDASRYHTWYFSWKGNLKRKAEFSNSLFEAVFSAPHGMVTGYEKAGGMKEPRFVPKLRKNRGLQADEMECQTRWILKFTKLWLAGNQTKAAGKSREKDAGESKTQSVLRPDQAQAMLRLLMGSPDAEEAKVYGDYLFSDDVTERRTHPLAQPMTEEELLSGHIVEKWLRLYVKKALPVKESAWYEGSAARYSCRAAWHQRHYRRYKRLIYVRKEWERKMKK